MVSEIPEVGRGGRARFVAKLINKDGLEVQNSAKAVFEELMRGTGCVMAEELSIFMEGSSLDEKFLVVAKKPDRDHPVKIEKFPSGQFKSAWELFQQWSQPN